MFASATTLIGSFNWYDVVVVIALGYGVWSGIRTGLTGELVRLVGWALTTVAALKFYQPAGQWLSQKTGMASELGNLIVFISIVVALYLAQLGIRTLVHKRVKRFKFGALTENIGGGAAGALRMFMVMMCLTVTLCLMRSPKAHEQIGRNSVFGSYVVSRFPAVAAMLERKYTETLWFTEELKRREDPDIPDDKTKKR